MSSTTSASAPSSSPSSSGYHFPVLPRKEQPNTHPYAIQTSSTAILSRSNSTSAHASVGPHHYIPMSPSPTSPQHSPTKQHRPSRHRYSRSLTSDQPPPLPTPPGAVSNHEEDSNTPRRHGHRAETLPSSAGPPLQNLDLPDDPKSWTPSQLSMYLSATMKTGDTNLPAPVAKDIATFVNDRRITGKMFLRLSEDDLLQFEINQLWRSTLLAASRGLRQKILRGRIWGFGSTPSTEEDEPGNNSFPSTASSNGNKAPRSRSRHSSLASDHGRVKGLVHSLEQSSPTRSGSAAYGYEVSDDSDNGGFSAKAAKRMSASNESFSSNHYPSTPSPSKNNRSLPARGSVNDLFNPPTAESDTAVQEKEDDPTIKFVAKRNVNGREPRMLPFPPSQAPMLTPMHTGSHFPLPLSPEHTGTAYGHLHTADYEMGFRSRTHSPYSQAFVVRHNPSSPSNVLRDEVNSKRLLPFPPVTGETHLHHPKPRRLVGNIDDPSVTDSGYVDDKGHETNGATDSVTSGTEGYGTALETQNEGEEAAPYLTVNGGHEEPTVQELVASEPTSKPISGVEAWELDLGDTVKRIGGDDRSDFKGGASVSEIGRKAGKHPTAPRGARGITDVSKRGQILDLFDPLRDDNAKSSDGTSKSSETAVLEGKGPELEKDMHSREQHLFDVEQTVAERERVVFEREQIVSRKEQVIAEKEQAIQRRELEVERRERAVSVREQGLSDRQVLEAERLSAKQKELQEQIFDTEDRQRLLHTKQTTLENQELHVATREERIRGREAELRLWQKQIEIKEEALNGRIEAAALAVSESSWPVPVSILRKCWRMLGMDASTTADPTVSRMIPRDILFGPSRSGGYLVLMSIGVCVVALRVLGKIRRR